MFCWGLVSSIIDILRYSLLKSLPYIRRWPRIFIQDFHSSTELHSANLYIAWLYRHESSFFDFQVLVWESCSFHSIDSLQEHFSQPRREHTLASVCPCHESNTNKNTMFRYPSDFQLSLQPRQLCPDSSITLYPSTNVDHLELKITSIYIILIIHLTLIRTIMPTPTRIPKANRTFSVHPSEWES